MNKRGSISVEFAFMLSIIVFIISGTIDYGLYSHRQMSLVQASHAAIRYASMNPNDLNGAITIGESSFSQSTGMDATFEISLVGTKPDIHVNLDASSNIEVLFGLVAMPQIHAHHANIRVSEQ